MYTSQGVGRTFDAAWRIDHDARCLKAWMRNLMDPVDDL
jgi:hypothetical protein